MLNINIDASAYTQAQQDLQTAVDALHQGIIDAGAFIRDTWVAAVSGQMYPGMVKPINDDKYAKAITTAESMGFTGFRVVVGPVGYRAAQDYEDGMPAWDMKPSLLNGPKSRPLKSGQGRYNIIPFRHYTPKGPGAGSSAIAVQMTMPQSIYNQAKRLPKSLPNPATGRIQWGPSLDVDMMGGINRTSLYQHKTNRYQGMYRVGAEKHTQYLTFRMVSTPRVVNGKRKGSAPNSWIHPAMPRNPVMEAVFRHCAPVVERNLTQLLEEVFV